MKDDTPTPIAPTLSNPDYKDRDIAFGTLKKFLIIIFGIAVLSMVAMWGLYASVMGREKAAHDAVPEAMRTRQIPSPDGVVLQSDELSDLHRYQQEKAALLHTYGWADKEKGIAHIPVERAMAIALEKKIFPVRKN